MKICFISNYHGQGAVTSNILAIISVFAKEYKQNVILTQTHFEKNNLQRSLLGSDFDKDDVVNYDNTGIDALLRYNKSGVISDLIVNNCSVSLYNKQLKFIPGTLKKNKEIYMADMVKNYPDILNALDQACENVFIDTNSSDDALTKATLESADLIVANMSQNIAVINEYFSNEHLSIYLDKTVFLIGNYNCNSKYNLKNLIRNVKGLRKDNVGVVPYNVEYLDSQCDGKVLEYFEKNIGCKRGDSNYYFIKSVKEAAKIINKTDSHRSRKAV